MENVQRILDRIEELGNDLNNIISINISSNLLNEGLEYILDCDTENVSEEFAK